MVNVGMGQDNMVEFGGIEHQLAVQFVGLETFALEHAAIEQNGLAAFCRDEMFAARHFARCAYKFDLHGEYGLDSTAPIWPVFRRIKSNQKDARSAHISSIALIFQKAIQSRVSQAIITTNVHLAVQQLSS